MVHLLDLVIDGISILFKWNLPKAVHRLRVVAWVLFFLVVVCFALTFSPSLVTIRQILKFAVVGILVIFIGVLVALNLWSKYLEE